MTSKQTFCCCNSVTLSFVLSTVLLSIDGALHNEEKAIEKQGQVGVGQAGVQATICEQLLSNQEEKEAKQVECHYVVGM
jgi:hypothetical protein